MIRFGASALCTLIINFIFVAALQAQSEKIDPRLSARIQAGADTVPVIVVLEATRAATGGWGRPSPAEVEYQLKLNALEKQARVRDFVDQQMAAQGNNGSAVRRYKPFWSTNAVMLTTNAENIWEMAQFEEVKYIMYDRKVGLVSPRNDSNEAIDHEGSGDFTYGLKSIGIPQLRESMPALTGEGVIVGILDTGIDAKHPELEGRVLAWKDFIDSKTEPYDDNGHGTHVAGTIGGVGSSGTQIGVAPGVKFVIGKILSGQGSGSLSGILNAMEWITNPGRRDEENLRPRVVNNSWGGALGNDVREDPFTQAIVNWLQMDIVPAFAAGNEGPDASTVGSPGGLPGAFAVGATDENDSVTEFSSRGPVVYLDHNGEEVSDIKPDVSAPGFKVLSAWPGGGYASLSGTSMATPHVTGAVALICQANPSLHAGDVMRVLQEGAVDLGSEGKDNDYGFGRIDLPHSIEKVQEIGGSLF